VSPQLVIFDCDGVLVDSEVISNEVLAGALTAEGLPTTLAQARREYQGLLLADILTRAQERLGRPLPEGWISKYESDRTVAFRRELRAVAGAGEAVRRIVCAGVKVCVASQGKLEKTKLSLELTGLTGLFAEQELFSAYSVARGKPHPDLFLHAAASMEVDPSRCVVVEDSPSGVKGAVSAGMRVLGYTADSDPASLREAGAELLKSMSDLPAHIDLGR
jgi:beta-phosphoglucomutase-like phosphatase (HAD superfamily)